MRVCFYTYRCPCAKKHREPNTISSSPLTSLFLPLTLSVSLTSQHAARGQTCISLRSPLSLSLSLIFFFNSPPLFSPLLSLAFQPSFVVAERRGGREEGGGSPKHERRQNVNGGALCRGAHGRCRASLRHQSVVVLTLMFSCVDQKLLWSETSGGRGGASVACQKLKHLGEKKNRTPTPTINEQQSDTYFVQLRQVMVL